MSIDKESFVGIDSSVIKHILNILMGYYSHFFSVFIERKNEEYDNLTLSCDMSFSEYLTVFDLERLVKEYLMSEDAVLLKDEIQYQNIKINKDNVDVGDIDIQELREQAYANLLDYTGKDWEM